MKTALALSLLLTLGGCGSIEWDVEPMDLRGQVPQGSQLDPIKSGETFLCISPEEAERAFFSLDVSSEFDVPEEDWEELE